MDRSRSPPSPRPLRPCPARGRRGGRCWFGQRLARGRGAASRAADAPTGAPVGARGSSDIQRLVGVRAGRAWSSRSTSRACSRGPCLRGWISTPRARLCGGASPATTIWAPSSPRSPSTAVSRCARRAGGNDRREAWRRIAGQTGTPSAPPAASAVSRRSFRTDAGSNRWASRTWRSGPSSRHASSSASTSTKAACPRASWRRTRNPSRYHGAPFLVSARDVGARRRRTWTLASVRRLRGGLRGVRARFAC